MAKSSRNSDPRFPIVPRRHRRLDASTDRRAKYLCHLADATRLYRTKLPSDTREAPTSRRQARSPSLAPLPGSVNADHDSERTWSRHIRVHRLVNSRHFRLRPEKWTFAMIVIETWDCLTTLDSKKKNNTQCVAIVTINVRWRGWTIQLRGLWSCRLHLCS